PLSRLGSRHFCPQCTGGGSGDFFWNFKLVCTYFVRVFSRKECERSELINSKFNIHNPKLFFGLFFAVFQLKR
ncbi:MAG: hypothetical protein AB2822_17280, partial [Candidatus Thiodiazotropha endolucinida]